MNQILRIEGDHVSGHRSPDTNLIGVLMGIVWAGGANCPYPLLGGALAVVVKGLLMGWVMGE